MRKSLFPRVYSPDTSILDKLDDKSKSELMSPHKGHSKTSWMPLNRQQVVWVSSKQNAMFAKKELKDIHSTGEFQLPVD